ncbi:tyrosine-type recombinase/integrase [Flavobacterium covae]
MYNYLEKDRVKLLQYNNKKETQTSFILGQYGEKINPHGIGKMINEQKPKSEQIQPMKIRQSVIANLLKKENDTRIVQVFSGHRRASTTIQYKQTELEQLQQAVNQYHPIK